jgi:hypothetical protein
MCYTITTIITALVQRLLHRISLIHEFAHFSLVYVLLITSGLASMRSGTRTHTVDADPRETLSPGTRVGTLDRLLSRGIWIVTQVLGTVATMRCTAQILLYVLLILDTYSLRHVCSEENQVFWWFLGARINLVNIWYLPVCIVLGLLVLGTIRPLHRLWYLAFQAPPGEDSKLRLVGTTIEFVVLVAGIEISIRKNGLESAENNLGFDQVRFVDLHYYRTLIHDVGGCAGNGVVHCRAVVGSMARPGCRFKDLHDRCRVYLGREERL